ncbi:MAG: T9SS type A sorting domain-containing protein [Chitinophagales bacterium]
MKQSLSKKLAAYSGLVSAVMLSKSEADAQIVYVNPPDVILTHGELKLDLDNNGIVDFNLVDAKYITGEDAAFVGFRYLNSVVFNVGFDCDLSYSYLAKIIKPGKEINTHTAWYKMMDFGVRFCFSYYPECNFPWRGKHHKFIGLRFLSNPNDPQSKHYAWMRVSVGTDCNLIVIHDWAYSSTPNESIYAGQMMKEEGTIAANESTDPEIFSYGKTVTIENNADDTALDVHIYNSMGQLMKTFQTTESISTIDLNDFATGIYIVQAMGKGKSWDKKVIID